MVILMTMIMVNIFEAKAKLSEYVEAAAAGERVLICKRNRPVVELRAVQQLPASPRNLEPLYPDWKIDQAFFEPLNADDLEAWEGSGDEPARPARVAERAPAHAPKRKHRPAR